MRIATLCAVVALAAASARAHIVPVAPSTCAFDPVSLDAPGAGVTATAAPAGPADRFTIRYDPQASAAQFDLTAVPPRAFTAAGVAGTLGFPGFLQATLRDSGDLQADASLVITTNGSAVTVPVHLTTGLATAGGMLVEGTPLGSDGHFVLVGANADSSLPAPLAGPLLVVHLAGTATPPPDIDQFRLATRTTPVSATATARLLRVRAILAPGANDTPGFPGHPALLRASSGDTTVATIELPSGLPAHGRKLFVGRTGEGEAALGVRALRRSGHVAYLLALKVKQPTMPAATVGTVPVTVTFDVGGLLSRTALPMRVRRHGTQLRYP